MRIFIGADHRGFELKEKVIDYLHEKNVRIEDLGAYEYDANDDYPDFAKKVVEAVLQAPDERLGIVICGSGVGADIVANRHKKIRCGLAINKDQVQHAREKDHINILSLASDYTDFNNAVGLLNVFIETVPTTEEKYLRRIKKTDEVDIHTHA
ncbi:MAG: RpiB/LacA/LacB family sugar-phosphate isomerase [Patescibacteria group bacterium]